MSDWDIPNAAPTENQILDALAQELKIHAGLKKTSEEAAKRLAEKIAAYFPDEVGEYEREVGQMKIKVARGERLSWDSDILEQMVPAVGRPPHIEMRLSVPKKAWDKLDDPTRAALLPALTRSTTPAKVTVEG